jgi:ubiquinone/menaquinone biosynthesis C-methylase UbiE
MRAAGRSVLTVEATASGWDREASSFDDEADHGLRDPDVRQAWRDLLNAHLPAAPSHIADLGCGTGSLAVVLADGGHAVTGVDFSAPMLAEARAKSVRGDGAVALVLGDAASPPLRPRAFDAVVCRHVLWALTDIDAALGRWTGLLRPGGSLVLIEGRWSTGGGLEAHEVTDALAHLGRPATVTPLGDERLWGREIEDDRYLILS